MKILHYLSLLPFLIVLACNDSKPRTAAGDSAAFDAAVEVVASLKKDARIEYELAGGAADGIPTIFVTFEEFPEPDYDRVVGLIKENETVQSYGGESLQIMFQIETKERDPEKDITGKILQTGTYDARTGEKIQ